MEAVGQLAGGIAHDFNNLLTAITGYSEFALGRLAEDDELRPDVEQIKKSAERAASLTSQLLAFSRRQFLRRRVVDVNSLVSDMENMLRRLIGEDIELVTELTPDIGRVSVDPGSLDQAVMNLAVNARDAMPRGGTLTLRTEVVDLDGAAARDGQPAAARPGGGFFEAPGLRHGVGPGRYVVLSVSDTGEGMDEETCSHLFEPFFTTKEVGKGTGLGLSVVYGIVKQSEGDISVESSPGSGTTFTIYLPSVEKDEREPERSKPRAGVRGGSETVLLVEDEDTLRRLATRILELGGYEVLAARDGREALRTCEENGRRFDLVVTDVVMPGMGGRELVEELKRTRPGLKALYVSGYTDDIVVRNGVLPARTAFLQKPYTPSVLLQTVREMLDARGDGV
jgi:CheY-like chemotaxis protein